jgi:hypothetical protein
MNTRHHLRDDEESASIPARIMLVKNAGTSKTALSTPSKRAELHGQD